MPSLTSLAEEALAQAKKLDDYLLSQGRSHTSFEDDTLFDLPSELVKAQELLINSTYTLQRLTLRPQGIFKEIMWACPDATALEAISEFRLAKYVPFNGTTTFSAIAQSTGLPQSIIERIMRQAMSNHIFTEDSPGHVRHTAASRQLATDADLNDTIAMMAQDIWKPCTRLVDAIKEHPECEEASKAAFTLAYEPGVPMFSYVAKHPERARRFGGAMRYFATWPAWDLKYLVRGFDWASLDHPGTTFVDVGGGQGTVPRALATATRHMDFIVQDLEGTIEDGRKILPKEMEGRITFMRHDFFAEQPVKGADVYFMRWILHDWSDKYCIVILRALVPALKDGARVVLYERELKDGPETRATEKFGRSSDLVMLAQFNGQERTRKGFERLLGEADSRFVLKETHRPEGCAMCVIEIVWDEKANGAN